MLIKSLGMYWLVYREHFPYSLPALVQLWHYRVCSSHKEQTGCGARNERSKEKPTLENTPMKCVCGRWPLLWWNPRRAAQYGIDLALPVVMNWRAFSKFFFRFPDKRDVRAHLEDSNAPQCQFHGAQSVQFLIQVVLNQCEKKSLKFFWLVNFLIKMEFILRRTKALASPWTYK